MMETQGVMTRGIAYHEDNNGIRPDGVDIIYQIDVGVVVIPPWNIVGMAVVVATHLDDY